MQGFHCTSTFYGYIHDSIVDVHHVNLIGRAFQPLLYFRRSVIVVLGAHYALICRLREWNGHEQNAHNEKHKAAAAEPHLFTRDCRLSQAENHEDHAAHEKNREKVGHKEEKGAPGCIQLTFLKRNPDNAQRRHKRDGDGNAAHRVGDFSAGRNEGAGRAPLKYRFFAGPASEAEGENAIYICSNGSSGEFIGSLSKKPILESGRARPQRGEERVESGVDARSDLSIARK